MIQYLVTAYGQHEHLRRLCGTLRRLDPACAITVQYDQSKLPLDPTSVAGATVVDTPAPVTWGDASYLDALLASLRGQLVEPWDWLVLLSGQDYPLRPPGELIARLDSTGKGGVLYSEVVPEPGPRPTWTEEQRRYWFRHRWLPRWLWRAGAGGRGVGRVVRAPLGLPGIRDRAYFRTRPHGEPGGIGVRVRTAPYDARRPCRKGSDYVVLRRALVEDLLELSAAEQPLMAHLRRTAIPTEAWFHTLLTPGHEAGLVAEVVHFTRFEQRANPRVLLDEDLTAARASGKFFARKFDASSGPLLDRVDAEWLGLG